MVENASFSAPGSTSVCGGAGSANITASFGGQSLGAESWTSVTLGSRWGMWGNKTLRAPNAVQCGYHHPHRLLNDFTVLNSFLVLAWLYSLQSWRSG